MRWKADFEECKEVILNSEDRLEELLDAIFDKHHDLLVKWIHKTWPHGFGLYE